MNPRSLPEVEIFPPGPTMEPRSSVLGPADPEALEHAADELRDRTMSLEPVRAFPALRLAMVVTGLAFLAAILLLVYRIEARALLRAIGL